jgi:hypothetical protein
VELKVRQLEASSIVSSLIPNRRQNSLLGFGGQGVYQVVYELNTLRELRLRWYWLTATGGATYDSTTNPLAFNFPILNLVLFMDIGLVLMLQGSVGSL